MKTIFADNKKLKAISILLVALVLLITTNYYDRKSYNDLDKTVTSIYKDRLMPAGYLFEISNLLYEKMVLQQASGVPQAKLQTTLQQHNERIDALMKKYEATYLIAAEKKEWRLFKSQLLAYNKAENIGLEPALLQPDFSRCITSLNKLNTLQSLEGKVLQRQSEQLISGNLLNSYFTMSLLVVVFFMILSLANMPGKNLFSASAQKPMLN